VALNGLKVHPTQLYEAGGAFLLFIFCQKRLFNRHFLGEVGLKAVIGYAILRFVVEGFRGDTYRGFILGGLLSYSQLISGVLIIAASSLLVVLLRKTPR
ncbi:MAG: prolipoprotein diacylglyceryl transferase family protein, partial [Pseudomonadota bacterium]